LVEVIEPPGDVDGALSRNIVVHGSLIVDDALLALGPTTIDHNVVLGSPGSGIVIEGALPSPPTDASGPLTLTGNVAIANQGHGIDAEWVPGQPSRIVDGGGNRAFLNHTQPQCIGVTCRGLF
jgi:hypothetical protein